MQPSSSRLIALTLTGREARVSLLPTMKNSHKHSKPNSQTRPLGEIVRESLVNNIVGFVVAGLVGGLALFFLERQITARGELRKDRAQLTADLLPQLDRIEKAIGPMDSDEIMSHVDDRAEYFGRVVKSMSGRWDKFDQRTETLAERIGHLYGPDTETEFMDLAEEIRAFHDEVEKAATDKNLSNNAVFLDDNSSSYRRFIALSDSSDHIQQKISELRHNLGL